MLTYNSKICFLEYCFSKSNATKIYNALRSSTSSLSSASSLAGTIAAVIPELAAAAPVLALISVGAGTITRQLKKGKTAFVNW